MVWHFLWPSPTVAFAEEEEKTPSGLHIVNIETVHT